MVCMLYTGGWFICRFAGQIKMGFNIIANAFKSRVKALEEDLRAANEERSEMDQKVSFPIFDLETS